MVLKQTAYRGTRRIFEVYITDSQGNAQDPDSCRVTFQEKGAYSYDSPRGPFQCNKTGDTGYWGYTWAIPESITLGDWLAKFEWFINGAPAGDGELHFILKDLIRPYINKPYLPANSEVIG